MSTVRAPKLVVRIGCALALLTASCSTAGAQPAEARADVDGPPLTAARLLSEPQLADVIRRFDFNERPLGNFEEIPAAWERLTGPGLPAHAIARIDDDEGQPAPSVRLGLAGIGSNVALAYRGQDIAVEPGADYRARALARASGLRHARAFMAAYVVDAAGERIAGSEAVSELVGGAAGDDSWRSIELVCSNHTRDGRTLRLQLWILQAHLFRAAHDARIAPIQAEDVRAAVWFDELVVLRVPQLQVRLSAAGNILQRDETAELILECPGLSIGQSNVELTVRDASGRELVADALRLDIGTGGGGRWPIPRLPPGWYAVTARVTVAGMTAIDAQLPFAVLAPLPDAQLAAPDFGADLVGLSSLDASALAALLPELRARACRFGVPAVGTLNLPEHVRYFRSLSESVRALNLKRIDAAGVLLAPPRPGAGGGERSLRDFVTGERGWREAVLPPVAELSNVLMTWQLDHEAHAIGAAQGGWLDGETALPTVLASCVSRPEIMRPVSVFNGGRGGGRHSLYVPARVPPRDLGRVLDGLGHTTNTGDELYLEAIRDAGVPEARREADLLQRLAIARALFDGRIFFAAPVEALNAGGAPQVVPGRMFGGVRTLLHFLTGRTPAGALDAGPNTVALVFRTADEESSGLVVAWTWEEHARARLVDLQLEGTPRLFDMDGVERPLESGAGGVRVPVSQRPVVIDGVNVPLTLLRGSFAITPEFIQTDRTDERPTVRFRNFHSHPVAGSVVLHPPAGWNMQPLQFDFNVPPGEAFEQSLALRLPPRQIGTTQAIQADLALRSPQPERLKLEIPVTVGLRDVRVEIATRWSGDDLVVEQTLTNQSSAAVGFTAFLDAPARPRLERAFLQVPPQEHRTQTYTLRDARALAGRKLRAGVQEIQGTRALEQLVEIPQ